MRRLVALPLAVLLLIETTGCSSWRAVPAPIPENLSRHRVPYLKLALDSGEELVLAEPRISGDSVLGVLRRPKGAVDSSIAVPLVRVRRAQRYSEALTPFGIVVVSAAGVAALVACLVQGCFPNQTGSR